MDKEITIQFADFWATLDRENNPITRALRARHRVKVLPPGSPETPDILFYSCCGNGEHYRYDCLKVYYTGENGFPNLNECDYAISFYDYDCGGRNLRYPLYMFYEVEQATAPSRISDNEALNRAFCSAVISNTVFSDPMRLRTVDAVESYKPLAYGGAFRNNTGGRVPDKLQFIKDFKFNLALENSDVPGYVTEKILEPFAAYTVPIYWGNKAVSGDFNPEAFINVADYVNIDSFVTDLKHIDNDDTRYLKMLHAPNYVGNTAERLNASLIDFLDRIVRERRRYTCRYGEMGQLLQRNSMATPVYRNRYTRKMLKLISKFVRP